MYKLFISSTLIFLTVYLSSFAASLITDQIVYGTKTHKRAILKTNSAVPLGTQFVIFSSDGGNALYTGTVSKSQKQSDWSNNFFSIIDFTDFEAEGFFTIEVADFSVKSAEISINKSGKIGELIPHIINYFNQSRADDYQIVDADTYAPIFGTNEQADVHGGWYDASGDISKYLSHLSFSNYMNPQQIPLVAWTIMNVLSDNKKLLNGLALYNDFEDEAAWGADYLARAHDDSYAFYCNVFDEWSGNPDMREICQYGSKEDEGVKYGDYEAAFREGGGMAIAALAKAGTLGLNGDFTSTEYIDIAENAYNNLLQNNKSYDNNRIPNIIDFYSALNASVELYKATSNSKYYSDAVYWANSILSLQKTNGNFICDSSGRTFWHASDAGMVVVSLINYLSIEENQLQIDKTLSAIKKNIVRQLEMNSETENPFTYPRQEFEVNGVTQTGFFIPHKNESNYWWQGENARLASISSSLFKYATLDTSPSDKDLIDSIVLLAEANLSWICGENPYGVCFVYGFGNKNPKPESSAFGHGPIKGGISNGITGDVDMDDGSGIFYGSVTVNDTDWENWVVDTSEETWRWQEQWLPHAAWFLQALSDMALYYERKSPIVVAATNKTFLKTMSTCTKGNSIIVRFKKPFSHKTRINIFEISGRMIKYANMNAGELSCILNITDMASGTYFLGNKLLGFKQISKF